MSYDVKAAAKEMWAEATGLVPNPRDETILDCLCRHLQRAIDAAQQQPALADVKAVAKAMQRYVTGSEARSGDRCRWFVHDGNNKLAVVSEHWSNDEANFECERLNATAALAATRAAEMRELLVKAERTWTATHGDGLLQAMDDIAEEIRTLLGPGGEKGKK
jgi:hypothetical protein